MGRAFGLRGAVLFQLTAWASTLVVTGCDVTDPRLDDLRVTGSVSALDGTFLQGATVTLVRTPCSGSTCAPMTRGMDVTASDGAFEIVEQREAVERDSWELVCHEFTLSVEAVGFASVVGDYQAWRGTFCAAGAAEGIEFRLQPLAGRSAP